MIISVAAELLLASISHGNEIHVRCTEGMRKPEDYKLVDVRLEDGVVRFFLQHKYDEAPNPALWAPTFEALVCERRQNTIKPAEVGDGN